MKWNGCIAHTQGSQVTYVVYSEETREEAWAQALATYDPFQWDHAPLPAWVKEEEESKLCLLTLNYRPMFVRIPKSRVEPDGKVHLSWQEIRDLGGLPIDAAIRLG